MNIHLSIELERLLKGKVAAGIYPSQEAVIEAALVRFLADEPVPHAPFGELIDHDFVKYCEREADDSVTLDEVRAATSRVQDSMARVIVEEERAERF
ncbi:MAG: hypothetical protein BGO49_04865 [Planctomycetales bacterium 71-10]|nr:MAG: hypothetical protein BGO49_04865 [Planctomycetales bacterium 71-10]